MFNDRSLKSLAYKHNTSPRREGTRGRIQASILNLSLKVAAGTSPVTPSEIWFDAHTRQLMLTK